ncbi:MAG: extracellular solute-binding protein [Anaerolineales bacterium]|nr:extracellular solute-binding protein [Anaerolineales bacterium]
MELEFSIIGEYTTPLSDIIEEFEHTHDAKVRVRQMSWENAWQELLTIVFQGQGPDVSQIGSTWTSSLIKMNVLRPFSKAEVNAVGGSSAFLSSSWLSALVSEAPEVYAIPWTSYVFVLVYRRDLLKQAGVDENFAFQSTETLAQTIERLQEAGVQIPWLVPNCTKHIDTLHFTASWVWEYGGDFISSDGKTPLFTHPQTIAGLKAYFDLFRYLPEEAQGLDDEQCDRYFRQGKAAATICGMDVPFAILDSPDSLSWPAENLGVVRMPGAQWIGGDNLVIWREASLSLKRERLAIDLVKYLTSYEVQRVLSWAEAFNAPTRLDVLTELPYPGSQVNRAIREALRAGRPYPSHALWGRVENQLSSALNQIGREIIQGKQTELAIRESLEPLERRLQIVLN